MPPDASALPTAPRPENRLRSPAMRNHWVPQLLAGLVIAGAAAVWLSVTQSFPPSADRALHREIGETLAHEALARLAKDAEITVITRDTADFPQPALDQLMAGFTRTVRQANARIGTVRPLEVDPLRLVEVPSGDFVSLLRRAKPGDVIVSLMGPPLLTPDDQRQLGPVRARVVAFCPGALPAQIDLRRLFADGLIHAAVVNRPARTDSAAKPRALNFDQSYRVVTATNIGALYLN